MIVGMPSALVRKLVMASGGVLLGVLLALGTMSALAASPEPSASASGSPGASPSAAAGGGGAVGDPTKGQQKYNQAGCSSCHGAGLEGGVGPKLNPLTKLTGSPDFKNPDDPAVADYLIKTITEGKAPSDGFGQMPAKGGSASLSDQDVKDIAAYIIQVNKSKTVTLGPVELARSNVFWVTVGIAVMVLLTYLLARYNMRWIARRAAARREGL